MALCVCCLLTGCYNANESRENVLKVYNWADYIGEGVLEDFQEYYKEQTGEDIRIVYQTFDINEIMLTKIEKGHEDPCRRRHQASDARPLRKRKSRTKSRVM